VRTETLPCAKRAAITCRVIAALRRRDDTGLTDSHPGQSQQKENVMTSIYPSRFLRNALIADALACTALVVLQLSLPDLLASLLQLPSILLTCSGVFLATYVGLLIVLASSKSVWKVMVTLVVVGNVAWALGCVGLAALAAPSGLGIGYLIAQAVFVLVIAKLEWQGLKGSQVAAPRHAAVA
jgi:hypothetical protein